MSKSKNPYPKFMEGIYTCGSTYPIEAIENNGWYRIYRYMPDGRRINSWSALRWYDLDRLIKAGTFVFVSDQKDDREISVNLLEVL